VGFETHRHPNSNLVYKVNGPMRRSPQGYFGRAGANEVADERNEFRTAGVDDHALANNGTGAGCRNDPTRLF
jgi:hypothetical protein